MKTIAFTILMAFLAMPLTAQDINECPDFAISEASQPNAEWLNGFDLCDEEIHLFLQNRMVGISFYYPALNALSKLSSADQVELMRLVDTGTPTTDGLIMELSVPKFLMKTILNEAQRNGADDFFELPGFDEALGELRTLGDTGTTTLKYLREFAPQSFDNLAIMAVVVEGERLAVEGEQLAAELEAVTAARDALRDAVRAAGGE